MQILACECTHVICLTTNIPFHFVSFTGEPLKRPLGHGQLRKHEKTLREAWGLCPESKGQEAMYPTGLLRNHAAEKWTNTSLCTRPADALDNGVVVATNAASAAGDSTCHRELIPGCTRRHTRSSRSKCVKLALRNNKSHESKKSFKANCTTSIVKKMSVALTECATRPTPSTFTVESLSRNANVREPSTTDLNKGEIVISHKMYTVDETMKYMILITTCILFVLFFGWYLLVQNNVCPINTYYFRLTRPNSLLVARW